MKFLIFACGFVVLSLFPVDSFAFRISPMVLKFSPEGKSRTQVIVLENPGSERVPVQVEVFRRTHDDGREIREKTEDFTVYPEQLVLLPNERRNVRLTWAGSASTIEQAYRVVVSQLPVKFKPRKDQADSPKVSLNLLLQYVASVYVVPRGVRPEVRAESVEVDDRGTLRVTLKNSGTAHLVLKKSDLTIRDSAGEEKKRIRGEKPFESENLLAGETRTFVMEKSGLSRGVYRADLKVEELAD